MWPYSETEKRFGPQGSPPIVFVRRSQWRIQDFPDGGSQPQRGGANLLFGQLFRENCMKMKENGPRGSANGTASGPLRFCTGRNPKTDHVKSLHSVIFTTATTHWEPQLAAIFQKKMTTKTFVNHKGNSNEPPIS